MDLVLYATTEGISEFKLTNQFKLCILLTYNKG